MQSDSIRNHWVSSEASWSQSCTALWRVLGKGEVILQKDPVQSQRKQILHFTWGRTGYLMDMDFVRFHDFPFVDRVLLSQGSLNCVGTTHSISKHMNKNTHFLFVSSLGSSSMPGLLLSRGKEADGVVFPFRLWKYKFDLWAEFPTLADLLNYSGEIF